MRRLPAPLVSAIVAVGLLTLSSFAFSSAALAAPIAGAPTVYCGDPTTDPSEDTGAGTMTSCVTTVTNTITTIDPVSGVPSGSAVVRVIECRGPASGRLDPSFLTCSTDQQNLVGLVTRVYQCNGVGYGGGNVLECSVTVVNAYVGVSPRAITAATVDQCVGSATDTTGCDPFPATTTNATITQCNGSSYGGGQEDFDCTATGTRSATLALTVNQCNDANYGGGSWLTCSARVSNTITRGGTTPSITPPPTSTEAPAGPPVGTIVVFIIGLLVLAGLAISAELLARRARP